MTDEQALLRESTIKHLIERELAEAETPLCDCAYCQWLVSLPKDEGFALIGEVFDRIAS